MAEVLAALDDADVLDGPPSARDIFTWQRDRLERPLEKKARVRVRGLRNNGHVVSPEECALIARSLARHPDEFVRSFGAFCAAAEGGIADGNDPEEPEPWSPPVRAFREDESIAVKVAKRLPKALAIAHREGEVLEIGASGLAAIDRLGPKKGNDERALSLAAYALECIRVMHGGVWGLAEERMPAVKLTTGVVVELFGVRARLADDGEGEWTYTLAELGETPVQM